jgi:hypothetical protein
MEESTGGRGGSEWAGAEAASAYRKVAETITCQAEKSRSLSLPKNKSIVVHLR